MQFYHMPTGRQLVTAQERAGQQKCWEVSARLIAPTVTPLLLFAVRSGFWWFNSWLWSHPVWGPGVQSFVDCMGVCPQVLTADFVVPACTVQSSLYQAGDSLYPLVSYFKFSPPDSRFLCTA